MSRAASATPVVLPRAQRAGDTKATTGDKAWPRASDDAIEVLISLGSNIRPELNLPRALRALAGHPGLHVLDVSRVWHSEAVGSPGPSFLNAAVRLSLAPGWRVQPIELKYEVLRPIERALGRRRSEDRNAPRSIDIDLSFFGDLVLVEDRSGKFIELPDPETLTRAHVALPLADVAPSWRHPTDGRRLRQIAHALERGTVSPCDGMTLRTAS
jgi:2-amino-4-hydroxy-6-hydroxymethyldihydropteridine diphosphokinase